jgi:hypothetical protein
MPLKLMCIGQQLRRNKFFLNFLSQSTHSDCENRLLLAGQRPSFSRVLSREIVAIMICFLFVPHFRKVGVGKMIFPTPTLRK